MPANPDIKQAARAAPKPSNLDCLAKVSELVLFFSVDDNCTNATPATNNPKAPHCHFFSLLFKTNTAKNAVVSSFS